MGRHGHRVLLHTKPDGNEGERADMSNKNMATAYHEAGHVVIGHRFGIRLGKKGVSIIPDGETSGRAHLPFTFRNNPAFDNSDRMRLHLERQAQVYFAGLEAQREFNPRSVRNYHASSDYRGAVNLLIRVHLNSEVKVLDAYIEYLLLKTRQLVKVVSVWETISAVAKSLARQQHLSRDEVEKVVRSVSRRVVLAG